VKHTEVYPWDVHKKKNITKGKVVNEQLSIFQYGKILAELILNEETIISNGNLTKYIEK
jgi:hypothetical protein